MKYYIKKASIEEYNDNVHNLKVKRKLGTLSREGYKLELGKLKDKRKENLTNAKYKVKSYEKMVLDYTLKEDLPKLYRETDDKDYKNAIKYRMNQDISKKKRGRLISYVNPLVKSYRVYKDPSDQDLIGV